jgi:hypothetical protein
LYGSNVRVPALLDFLHLWNLAHFFYPGEKSRVFLVCVPQKLEVLHLPVYLEVCKSCLVTTQEWSLSKPLIKQTKGPLALTVVVECKCSTFSLPFGIREIGDNFGQNLVLKSPDAWLVDASIAPL